MDAARSGEAITWRLTNQLPTHHTRTRPPQGFIRKWVFSLDHKVIGLQYYFLALLAVFVACSFRC